MGNAFKIRTFGNMVDAEKFVHNRLRYKDGAYKKHLISYSRFWECYIVSYNEKLIRKQ